MDGVIAEMGSGEDCPPTTRGPALGAESGDGTLELRPSHPVTLMSSSWR